MAEYIGFVENFNLVNCYVDTSYYSRYWDTIFTSKFSNEEEQIETIKNYFVVVANPGYKLKPEFSFKVQPQVGWDYDENIEWLEITQEDFQPLTRELNLNIDLTKEDFQLAGVNINNSLVYETEINNVPVYLFLLGGFNEHKLIFALYRKHTVANSSTYGDDNLSHIYFNSRITDFLGQDLGSISLLNDLLFTAESEEDSEPDINNSFFTTYYVNINTLREIKQKGTVVEELIINTYSYPIKFNEEQLVESTIKTGYISTEIVANIFKNNYTSLDIFKFTVPDISDVNECYIKIPFNNDISLDYEDIKGKTIRGYITYEVLTNTTTLFITDEEKILYKNIISLGVEIPYKPTGELSNYRNTQTRLAYEEPKLYIKGVGKSVKGNYLRGFIKAPNNVLKDELNLLNNLLNEGVYINDENN